MRVTITSQFTVSIILVVITTVKERRVVAITLLRTNVTSVDILIRHWIESATTVRVVTFTIALMARRFCSGRWHLGLPGNNQANWLLPSKNQVKLAFSAVHHVESPRG